MVVLLISNTAASVVVTTSLSAVFAGDELGVDCRIRRNGFCRKRRVEIRYQPLDRVRWLVVGQLAGVDFLHSIEQLVAEYLIVTVGRG